MAASTRTFSADDRLNRKRQAARIRQQRCRARKRAMAAAQLAVSKDQQVARVILDDKTVKRKQRKTLPMTNTSASSSPSSTTSTTNTHMKMSEMPVFKPLRMPLPSLPEGHHHPTTVDGVKMSKRAAVHAALLDEHNRKFFAQVAAERKTDKNEEKGDANERSHHASSHVMVKNNAQSGMHQSATTTPTKPHSPVRSYYRHAPYPYYPYPHHAFGPRPHGKYTAPHHHPAYPHSPPMYRAYDGRYHPILPHAMPHPRHFPAMVPLQHSMSTESASSSSASAATTTTSTTSLPMVVSRSVSDDERSTPSPEFSPASRSDEEEESSSLQSMEQEAIAAMLTLSNASTEEDRPSRAEPPQQPILLSQ
eukprot:scaffold1858_cov267-Amphora_coffeaeformis.AAC.1